MKTLYTLLFLLFITPSIYSQEPEETPDNTIIQLKDKKIIGKVVNASGKPIEAVTAQLYIKSNEKDSLIRGTFTKLNGDFSFENLPSTDSFKVVLSGIGYKEWSTVLPLKEGVTDLGNVVIAQDLKVMNNIVVTAQRPTLQMGIDRKVFNVERSITNTGGTALDVMQNIPSVSVDVDGNVLLRNASPQIFVDGRPTILTPDQIPADQIERIELITNPSAKFDASSTAGIINIVMKRSRRIGINGVTTIGGGYPSSYHGNFSLNARKGKVNFFVSGSYHRFQRPMIGETHRRNKDSGIVTDYFNQYSNSKGDREFNSLRFGLDFFATNRTSLSATQNIVAGNSESSEQQNQQYLDKNQMLEHYGQRQSKDNGTFHHYSTQLNFNHKFPEEGKELTANVNYNYGNHQDGTLIFNSFFHPNGSSYSDPAQVRNTGRTNNNQYTFQVDYTDPHGESGKFEAGIRSFINKQHNNFSSFSTINGQEVVLPLANNYSYNERVNAAYVSFSNAVKTFSYQLGLRAEVSRFEGELTDSAKTFGYDYPKDASHLFDALFPSIFLTKKINDNVELQANYSRRIHRPWFRQINPYIEISDPLNLQQGNPQLEPEFVNSFELNYNQQYTKGNFLGVIYYRNNQRDITRYSDTISSELYHQLNNPAIDPNAILNSYINAKSTNTVGLELTLEHRFNDHFSVVPTTDMQFRKVNADINTTHLSNSGFHWESKLTVNYKFDQEAGILKNLSLQLTGEYESKEVRAQGINLPQYRSDFGLRKEFLKDKKAAVSFNIHDIFKTQRWGNIYDTESFYQEGFRRRNARTFRINFTYKFGKNDFDIFKKESDRSEEMD